MVIEEVRVQVSLPITFNEVVPTIVEQFDNDGKQTNDQPLHDEIVTNELIVEEPQGVALRRFQRKRRSALPNDYMIYLREPNFDIGTSKDSILLFQAMKSNNSDK